MRLVWVLAIVCLMAATSVRPLRIDRHDPHVAQLDAATGVGETPSIYDPTFRADVLGPCAVAAGAQAVLAQQSGQPFDANKLTDVCAGAVGTRKVIKSIQGM